MSDSNDLESESSQTQVPSYNLRPYTPPKTTLIDDLKIEGGSQWMNESNNGTLTTAS